MNAQDPAEIDSILKQAFEEPAEGAAAFQHEVDLKGTDLTDNSEEAALLRDDAKRDGVTVPDLPVEEAPPAPPDSLFDSDPVKDAKTIIKDAFTADFDFAKIEVDGLERDRFYRCGLHDEEMYYLVDVPGAGLTVKVVMPPSSQSEAVVAALDHWRATERIGSNSIQYLHGFQLLNVWLMVREINGTPTDWYEKLEAEAGGEIRYRDLREFMCEPDNMEPVRKINEIRWGALSLAIRIADYKHQLCLSALRTKKVFTTADSA